MGHMSRVSTLSGHVGNLRNTNFGADLPQNWISGPEYAEMQEFSTLFEDIAVALPFTMSITGSGEPEQISAAASGNFFRTFKVEPA